MDFRFTEREEALRKEVRDFLNKELPPDWEGMEESLLSTEEGWAFYKGFIRKMAAKRWLNMHWPKEYGGLGVTPIERAVFVEEMSYCRAPAQIDLGPWVGSTLRIYGTEKQKRKFLPGITSGELEICIGYSEPNAGSDLASLQTRAEERDDKYVINGQKIWTSLAHRADYCWLAARTDPNVPKHRGISMFMVDMKTPGITVRPLIDIRGHHTFNEVFFDDVQVPKECLVGEKNQGWYMITAELDIERSSFGGGVNISAQCKRLLDDLLQYVKETKYKGKPLAHEPLIRQKLAQTAIEVENSRLLAYRVHWLAAKGIIANYQVSMSKIYGSEMAQRLANTGMQILGLYGCLEKDSKWARLKGRIQDLYLWSIAQAVGAGTNEIQRSIIAMRGLGLPRR